MKFEDIPILEIGNTIQLVGAVYANADIVYLCMMPDGLSEVQAENVRTSLMYAERLAAVEQVPKMLEMSSEDWEKFLRQTDILEVEVMTAAGPNKEIVKAIIRKSTRQISQGVSWQVYKRDSYKCRYCSADDVPLTVDHLVLWESGGPSTANNLLSACRKCNKTRGNMEYKDWLLSPHYLRVARNLTEETRQKNLAVAHTLDLIPRHLHGSSR